MADTSELSTFVESAVTIMLVRLSPEHFTGVRTSRRPKSGHCVAFVLGQARFIAGFQIFLQFRTR